jgi:hypothetical protein
MGLRHRRRARRCAARRAGRANSRRSCYEFFTGSDTFAALADEEPGTFYVTDFLLRHFDRLVIRGLGLDRHPELAAQYFRNYRRLVYLAQVDAPERVRAARAAAQRLGLAFEHRITAMAAWQRAFKRRLHASPACPHGKADPHLLARRAVAGRREAGPRQVRVQLSARFQEAVDRAAMRAGKGSSDAYIADWKRSEPRDCGNDLKAEAIAEIARIEARYSDADLEKLRVRAEGAPRAEGRENRSGTQAEN